MEPKYGFYPQIVEKSWKIVENRIDNSDLSPQKPVSIPGADECFDCSLPGNAILHRPYFRVEQKGVFF